MTDYLHLQGKLSWCKTQAPNKFGNWSVCLHPTPDSLEKVRELQAAGCKNVIKKDEDGYYVAFNRPTSKLIKGKVQGFAPPKVFDGTKRLPDGSFLELTDQQVGNGSDGWVKLEVYSHGTPSGGKAKAARLLSLRVDNLVPFQPARDYNEEEMKSVAGLDKLPEQMW